MAWNRRKKLMRFVGMGGGVYYFVVGLGVVGYSRVG